jgi:hypothetical protein
MPFMNFWLSVNLFANLFMILFRKSRSFRSCIWQHLYKSMRCMIDWWCNVLLPRVPNRVTGTCFQTLLLHHWRIFFDVESWYIYCLTCYSSLCSWIEYQEMVKLDYYRRVAGFQLVILEVIGTDCTGSC